MENQRIVSRDEWNAAHAAHLAKEKNLTRQRDALTAERRQLPWVKVDKPYAFTGPTGQRTLAELFGGRSQLLIKHFMFAPGWKEGCVGCSFETDHLDRAFVHLQHHDVSMVAVARAPFEELEAFRQRMGWRIELVSSLGSDFNYDFHVSFTKEDLAKGAAQYNFGKLEGEIEDLSGLSAFYKDEAGNVYHTYSCFGRGGEEVLGSYMVLDRMPKGRNETGPNFNLTDWVRHHDRYGQGGHVDPTGRYRAPAAEGSPGIRKAEAREPGCCSGGQS
ncbi:DUF899 domain-containing protein [Pendulispora albinea]|uniref:Thioredoxin family protein n=1 Tax=Pendulispora albinea TaxID=2741071 RepID=A0ABZ2LMG4_9BACT